MQIIRNFEKDKPQPPAQQNNVHQVGNDIDNSIINQAIQDHHTK